LSVLTLAHIAALTMGNLSELGTPLVYSMRRLTSNAKAQVRAVTQRDNGWKSGGV
jgi:hypothetical protein